MADPDFGKPKGSSGERGDIPEGTPVIVATYPKAASDGTVPIACGTKHVVQVTVTQSGVRDCATFDFQNLYDIAENLLTYPVSKILCDPASAGARCWRTAQETYRKWECTPPKSTMTVCQTVYCGVTYRQPCRRRFLPARRHRGD